MNANEGSRFRELIAERIAALDAEDALGRDGQSVVTLDQQSVGRLSRMDALQSQAMAKAGQARRDAERRKLAAALARIDEDEFGWCDECGEEIPVRRLELDPTATRCVACASG
ncbi:TraR/DksA family transcriptional regulator [Roseivivax sediminis]|uniref:Transcriptional regulator, TraR/DksA family n=1 Tax=Roseivivax sediminis TaxID=936889 RepID=A0A1I1STN4_9RHOB|nr:TraR/DksA C4-type zinc finger protein [Roseivivax sediminis]SFD49879.1 transcriptional regulator, TraR/DksA family [Roseivivax sediminis]